MTPAELWNQTFNGIEPSAFWAKASEGGCSQADEAVDVDLAAREIWMEEPEREVLSRYLCACVPGVPHDASQVMHLPGW